MCEAPFTDTDIGAAPGEDINPVGGETNIFGTSGRATDYFVAESYRPYQRETIEEIEAAYEKGYRHVVVDAPTGSGKSHIARALAFQSGNAHILTAQKILQDQYESEFSDMFVMKGRGAYECLAGDVGTTCANGPCRLKKRMPCDGCPYRRAKGSALSAVVTVHNFDSFYYQNSFGAGFQGRKLIIIDECFVGSTPVMCERGNTLIHDIKVGDMVWAYDVGNKAFKLKKVLNKFVKSTSTLYQVTFGNQSIVRCTGNHLFLTASGWVEANKLKLGMDIVQNMEYNNGYGKTWANIKRKSRLPLFGSIVQFLWNFFCVSQPRENITLQKTWGSVLFQKMWSIGKVCCYDGANCLCGGSQCVLDSYDTKQSHEVSGDTRKGIGYFTDDGLAAPCERWKREGLNQSSNSVVKKSRMGNRSDCTNFRVTSGRVSLPKALQDRCGESNVSNSRRGGRWFSWLFSSERAGSSERNRSGFARVESVEVIKQGSDGRFEELCPEGSVYDIEVEDLHTYVVNGVVVHNCHNIANKFSEFLSFTINSRGGITVPEADTLAEYDSFVKSAYADYCEEYAKFEAQFEVDGLSKEGLFRMQELSQIVHRMKRYLAERGSDNPAEYVFDYSETGRYAPSVMFRPVYVGDYASRWLFEYGERSLMMSATILDKEMFCKDVGLNPAEVYYVAVPSSFPAENRPIVKKYAGKMGYKDIDATLPSIVEIIEEIAAMHPDRKGIIQTHSEKIASYLKRYLDDPRYTFNKDYDTPQEMLEEHTNKPGSIIVASGLREGLDLRGDLSKVQIFCKIPYPSLGDKVVARKMELDPEWYGWMTTVMFIQALGRSVRSSKERAVTYILDSGFPWYYKRCRKFIPEYIRESIKW